MGTKISNAPIKEVVLELIIDNTNQPVVDYTILLSQLANEVKANFPKILPMPGSRFPIGFPEPIVRHRISDDTEKNLMNLGENVISINTLEYESFTKFKKLINNIIKKYFVLLQNYTVKRIGLRYVNVVENGKIGDVFSFQVPNPLTDNSKSFEVVHLYQYDDDTMSLRHNKGVLSPDAFVLDLDYYCNPNNQLTIEELDIWIEKAHEKIELAFNKSFKDGYLK